jgi:hypothetical protein
MSGSDNVVLASQPTVVDTTPKLFASPDGIPTHGPRNRVIVCLAPQFQFRFSTSGPVLVRPDMSTIIIHVVLVLADGTRHPLEQAGFSVCGHQRKAMQFAEDVTVDAKARARGIEAWADAPVQVDSIAWWSGTLRPF